MKTPFAQIGDRLQSIVRNPTPGTITMSLETADACSYANDLLAKTASAWRLIPKALHQDALEGQGT